MPEYTPPANDAVNFGLEEHSPPARDNVNFNLGTGDVVMASIAELDLGTIAPTATPTGEAPLSPGPAQVDVGPVEPVVTGDGTVSVAAEQPAAVSLAGLFPSLYYAIAPAPAELSLLPKKPVYDSTEWIIDSRIVDPTEVTLSPKTISITLEVDRDDIDHWREYDRVGNINAVNGFGGSFEVIDRAGRDSPNIVRPALPMRPPFDPVEGYISSYEERQQAPDRFTVTLTFQRPENRSEVFDPVEQSGGGWEFAFSRGTIVTDSRQVSQSEFTGTTASGQITLTLSLSDAQTATIADVAGFPDAIVERSVPDGKNFREDTSAASNQTVTVTSPEGSSIEQDDYLVQSWSVSMTSHGEWPWSVELQLSETN